MNQSSYLRIGNPSVYFNSKLPTYFGFSNGYLDIYTMRYRIFGAVWKLVDGKRYVLGYWFADKTNEIYQCIQTAGFSNVINTNEREINEIYKSIRMKQDEENWSKRSKLNFFFMLKKPWKGLNKGWYVLKSGKQFPIILTCIQKKRYSIWIEHIKVCENDEDIKSFLNLVNHVHNIKLTTDLIRMN